MKQILIFIALMLLCAFVSPIWAVNHVLSLDGHGDYVEIADSESLNAINSQVTMEAWIKPTAFTNGGIPIIYKADRPAPDNRSYALWLAFDGRLGLDSAPNGRTRMYCYSPVGSINLNTWYHVAGVIDGKNGVMTILINGIEVASGTFGKDIRVSSLPLRIGWTHENRPEHSPFAGQIDEVRIWNIARTQEKIKKTMFTTLSGKEPGFVGYWRFEDVGKIATDSSPSQSEGKLTGDAHFIETELPKSGEVVIPIVLSGMITNEAGQPIPNASVRLEQNGEEYEQIKTDASGNYRIVIYEESARLV